MEIGLSDKEKDLLAAILEEELEEVRSEARPRGVMSRGPRKTHEEREPC
ncbi:MAG: hypothetical protein JW775_01040 [Candidatus Aminicenantes bacterium]|nr:hypothetical protein [Candidatus Aminicenantes bacterium]